MRNHFLSRIKSQPGQSLVEFAFVVPILILIFMGIMDFGRLMFMYSQLSNAAREGARYGSVTGPSLANPRYADCTNIRNAVRATFAIPQAVTTTIQYEDDTNGLQPYTYSCETLPPIGNPPDVNDIPRFGDRIRVTVRSEFEFITPIVRPIASAWTIQMSASRTILRGGVQIPPGSR